MINTSINRNLTGINVNYWKKLPPFVMTSMSRWTATTFADDELWHGPDIPFFIELHCAGLL